MLCSSARPGTSACARRIAGRPRGASSFSPRWMRAILAGEATPKTVVLIRITVYVLISCYRKPTEYVRCRRRRMRCPLLAYNWGQSTFAVADVGIKRALGQRPRARSPGLAASRAAIPPASARAVCLELAAAHRIDLFVAIEMCQWPLPMLLAWETLAGNRRYTVQYIAYQCMPMKYSMEAVGCSHGQLHC